MRHLWRDHRLQLKGQAFGPVFRYYGAFAPGLEECIAEFLKERCADLSSPRLLSGALVFETSCPYEQLNLPCFNNLFRLHAEAGGSGAATREMLERFVRDTLRRGAGLIPASVVGSGPADRGFRVIFSLENTPAAVDADLRGKAEACIASRLGLRVERRGGGQEFWFLLRREGAFFMRRLSRHRPWDKLLHPGELPPPLAWTLCRLSLPRPGETIADPFCGYGSIPAARLRHFPPAEFYASDIDARALAIAKARFSGTARHHCYFKRLDMMELPRFIPPAGLDGIITDPPWGCYRGSGATDGADRGPEGGELYERSLGVFAGLLKSGGRVVMLCGREDEPAAERHGFTLARRIPILLSGKKATIYLLQQAASTTGR